MVKEGIYNNTVNSTILPNSLMTNNLPVPSNVTTPMRTIMCTPVSLKEYTPVSLNVYTPVFPGMPTSVLPSVTIPECPCVYHSVPLTNT